MLSMRFTLNTAHILTPNAIRMLSSVHGLTGNGAKVNGVHDLMVNGIHVPMPNTVCQDNMNPVP